MLIRTNIVWNTCTVVSFQDIIQEGQTSSFQDTHLLLKIISNSRLWRSDLSSQAIWIPLFIGRYPNHLFSLSCIDDAASIVSSLADPSTVFYNETNYHPYKVKVKRLSLTRVMHDCSSLISLWPSVHRPVSIPVMVRTVQRWVLLGVTKVTLSAPASLSTSIFSSQYQHKISCLVERIWELITHCTCKLSYVKRFGHDYICQRAVDRWFCEYIVNWPAVNQQFGQSDQHDKETTFSHGVHVYYARSIVLALGNQSVVWFEWWTGKSLEWPMLNLKINRVTQYWAVKTEERPFASQNTKGKT